jgi:biopolymer transport protein ExbD
MAISSKKTVEGDETVHHVTPSKKKGKPRPVPQPPMTPMIDVTFQLILFFILTFEFRETEGTIPGTLPSKGTVAQETTDTPPPDPIQIRVIPSQNRESATYEMTGVSMAIQTVGELGKLLEQRQQQIGSKEVPILIFPSQYVPWGFVVEAFNQAKKAKFQKIGFQNQEQEEAM